MIFFLKKTGLAFAGSAIILFVLFSLAVNFPDSAAVLHYPIALGATISMGALLLCLVLAIVGSYKIAPPIMRILSGLLLLTGLLIMEIMGRTNMENANEHDRDFALISQNKLIDYNLFQGDAFGATRYNTRTEFKQFLPDPLNSDGFRSPYQFNQATIDSLGKMGKKVDFFVGDSYTYGLRADSGLSFAETYDALPGHAVFNAGIPGTDLFQYASLVDEYIATGKIKPHRVVVFICGANDFFLRRPGAVPGVPLYYFTNAGNIVSVLPNGEVGFTAKQAYTNILTKIGYRYALNSQSSVLAATSFLFQLSKSPLMLFSKSGYNKCIKAIESIKGNFDYTLFNACILKITQQCAKRNVPVVFILLPGEEMVQTQKLPVINKVVTLNVSDFTLEDFAVNGGDHYNNKGHLKVCRQLEKLLP